MAKELLHEETGLRIWKNEKNQFVVCELRFEADPNKRSEEWLAEAKAGLSPGRFAREYLIQWDALDGQKVFPEIIEYRSKIVIPCDSVTFNEGHNKFFGAYDHGMRSPSAFIVFTQDESYNMYAIWEMYEPCTNMLEFTTKMKACPYWNKLKYIVADPALWDKRGYNPDGLPVSPYEMFTQYGIRNFVKGAHHTEPAWLLLMKGYWGNKDDIQFKIFENCQCLIEEFEGAKFANMTEIMATTRNPSEKMVDKNNHAMDATRYFMTHFRKQQQPILKSMQWKYKW